MKKRIFVSVFSIFLLLCCAGCDQPAGSDSSTLSPPAWIIGSWSADEGAGDFTFVFTDSNAVLAFGSASSSVSLDFSALYGSTSYLSDSSTESTYDIDISAEGTVAKYYFEKKDDVTLTYTNTVNGTSASLELTKE